MDREKELKRAMCSLGGAVVGVSRVQDQAKSLSN